MVSEKTPEMSEQRIEEQGKTEPPPKPSEIGGPKGPEPTRYNDWEKGGRCVDF